MFETLPYYILTVALLALMPGPDIIFVITQGILRGKKEAVFTSLGLGTGCFIHSALASFGVSVIFQKSELAFNILKYFGAAYLFYLAYKAWKSASNKLPAFREENFKKQQKSYLKGLMMNLLNPKVILFFLAFLPGFTPSGIRHTGLYMLFLGLIFMLISTGVFCLVSILSSFLNKVLIQNPKLMEKLNRLSALIIGALALILLFSNL